MKHVLWLLALLFLVGCGEFPTQEDENNDDNNACQTTQSSYDDDCDDDDDDDYDPYRPQSGAWKGTVTNTAAGNETDMQGLITHEHHHSDYDDGNEQHGGHVFLAIPSMNVIHVGQATGSGSNYAIDRLYSFTDQADAFLMAKTNADYELNVKADVRHNANMVGKSYRGSTQVSSFDIKVAGDAYLEVADITVGTWELATDNGIAGTLEVNGNGAFTIELFANSCNVAGMLSRYHDDDYYDDDDDDDDDDRYEDDDYDDERYEDDEYNNRLLHTKATATNCSGANLNGSWDLYVGKDGNTLIIAGQKGSEYVAYGEFRR